MSAVDVAVTITVAGVGALNGAMYRPVDDTVPHAVPEQPEPLTLQVTPLLAVPETLAVNCCLPPTATCAEVGDILTATGRTSVTVAVLDFVVSA